MDAIKAALAAEINSTNNGKLLIANVPATLRQHLPTLRTKKFIENATFIHYGDAIRLA